MRATVLVLLAVAGGCAAPAGEAPAPPAAPGDAVPRIEEGDRWFVAVRPAEGGEPFAVLQRRRRLPDGSLREEVTWARDFASVEGRGASPAQVFSVTADARGVGVALLDDAGKPVGTPFLEVAAPYAPGTAWEVEPAPGRRVRGAVEAREDVDTPAGPAKGALRVVHRPVAGPVRTMTTWYDAGLRPVRAEVRGEDGALEEARAMVPGDPPGPEACIAAVAWAKKAFASAVPTEPRPPTAPKKPRAR